MQIFSSGESFVRLNEYLIFNKVIQIRRTCNRSIIVCFCDRIEVYIYLEGDWSESDYSYIECKKKCCKSAVLHERTHPSPIEEMRSRPGT